MRLRLHEITIDCVDVLVVGGFWSALLDAPLREEPLAGWRQLGPLTEGGPLLNFQPVAESKSGKTRIHLDLLTDDLDAAAARVVELGGASSGERHEHETATVVVMADPEGNELCLVAGKPPS